MHLRPIMGCCGSGCQCCSRFRRPPRAARRRWACGMPRRRGLILRAFLRFLFLTGFPQVRTIHAVSGSGPRTRQADRQDSMPRPGYFGLGESV